MTPAQEAINNLLQMAHAFVEIQGDILRAAIPQPPETPECGIMDMENDTENATTEATAERDTT